MGIMRQNIEEEFRVSIGEEELNIGVFPLAVLLGRPVHQSSLKLDTNVDISENC
jgi:hypothetical protein